MTSLAARVLKTIRARQLVVAGDRLAVAVSGGPDSVALLHLLLEVARPLEARVVVIAHLNHRLRPVEADRDEQFCRDLAARLGIAIDVESIDVGALARAGGRSVEHAGHAVRYAFYERVLDRTGASRLATGHTRTDQAETVLLRLIRGAGTPGLAGIRPARGRVIRPLLEVARPEIECYLARHGIVFRVDASNADVDVPRNRVRHELLPLLEQRFSPRVVASLARTAALLRDEDACLDLIATETAERIVQVGDDGVRIDIEALRAQPIGLRRRILRRALSTSAPGRSIGARHVECVLALADRAHEGTSAQVAGRRAEVAEGCLILVSGSSPATARPSTTAAPPAPSDGWTLPVPGQIADPGGRWVLVARGSSRAGEATPPGPATRAVVDAASVRLPLRVRFRRAGDRLRPLGMAGRKRLQDLFVDRKVPRAERDRVPLVVDAADRIVWVAGHAVGHDFRVTAATTAMLLFDLRLSGG